MLFVLFLYGKETKEDYDINETGKRISERVFHRSQARVNKLYWNVIALCDNDKDLVADYLDDFVEMLMDDFFVDIQQPLLDNTKCARAHRKVNYEEGIPVLSKCSCTKKNNQCDICEFWKKRTEEADKLQESLIDEHLKDILASGKNSPEEYKGNNCKDLGDAIVVLESKTLREEFGVCSSNKKDFKVICECLDVNLLSPDYSFTK